MLRRCNADGAEGDDPGDWRSTSPFEFSLVVSNVSEAEGTPLIGCIPTVGAMD